ncbi:MAG: carbon-nitrogen hydrolase family protein [Ignavibacteriales bacterium]|nr:carbon-nitrogen hydrolase family protein [Ignavibacteriales bacterium]
MNLILLQPTLRAFDSKGNLEAIELLVAKAKEKISSEDILLLPEHFTFDDDVNSYDDFIRKLASLANCTVVGGSHHRTMNGKRINYGIAVDRKGNEIGNYSKLRPYFHELNHVFAGDSFGEFQINGKNFLVLICADFWYSDLMFKTKKQPDVILVPSLSVSRKPNAGYSQSLWKHTAITRAFEFGAFVGISDWSENSLLQKNRTCGVGGFTDPTTIQDDNFFYAISSEGISMFKLDFDALDEFRSDRKMRGFFWSANQRK